MTTIIGYQRVRDTGHWLSSPAREEVLGPLGGSNIRTFVDRQNPQQVAVLMDVADLDAFLAAAANPPAAMAAAMKYDGVLPETITILVESLVGRRRVLVPD
jgi:hypothetical protein